MNPAESDSHDTLLVARNLVMLGQLSDARSVLVAGLRLGRGRPDDLTAMAGELATVFERMHDPVGALACAWHLGDVRRMEVLEQRVPAKLAARSWALRAREVEGEEQTRHRVLAAELFARDRKWMHAAAQWEAAGAYPRALAAWQDLTRSLRVSYQQALCQVRVAHVAWKLGRNGDADVACEQAVRSLQATAGWHSRQGRPDMAADCHAVVVEVAQAWGRSELAHQAMRAAERELQRDVGIGTAVSIRVTTTTVTGELLAWENAWDVTETTADWMTLGRDAVDLALALELRLLALETEGNPSGAVVYALSRLAHGLGEVGLPALIPLGVLSRRRSGAVRMAVARSLGRIHHPRSLRALMRALDDPDPAVVVEARKSIGAMRGPEVLGGVLKLIGTGTYARGFGPRAEWVETRRAAFSALAGTKEAEPVVSWILEHGGKSDRRLMGEVLEEAGGAPA